MLASFRSMWQRLAVAAVAALAIGLIAAAPVQLSSPPVLIVFPFEVGPGLQAAAGVDYATRIGAAIDGVGGVTVVPVPAANAHATEAEFPAVARAAGADYYLTGFVSPVGGTVTVIQQLVSLRSGTIVWSNSAQVLTQADALAQATLINRTLQQYSSRGYFALGLQRPTPAPGPKATARPAPPPQNVQNIPALPNEAYGYSSAPTPQPQVYASADNPSRYAVLTIAGKGEAKNVRDYTANALIFALGRQGQTAALGDPDNSEFPIVRGPTICAQTGAAVLVWGTIATTSADASLGLNPWTTATLQVEAFDCKNRRFVRNTTSTQGSAAIWKAAIDRASDQAVKTYLLALPATST